MARRDFAVNERGKVGGRVEGVGGLVGGAGGADGKGVHVGNEVGVAVVVDGIELGVVSEGTRVGALKGGRLRVVVVHGEEEVAEIRVVDGEASGDRGD